MTKMRRYTPGQIFVCTTPTSNIQTSQQDLPLQPFNECIPIQLNWIELNWNKFVKWLKREVLLACLNVAGGSGTYECLAGCVLSHFSHDDNLKNYIKCGYLGNINN